MDAQRTSFVLTIAALLAGTALAEPPSQSAPVRYSGNAAGQNNWSSAGPTSIPTISASPTERYGNPQYTYPQNTQPQSITQRVQNGVNETATTVRNGVDTSIRAVGQQFSPAATNTNQQTFGTAAYPSQTSNPFATQPAAPPASSTTRGLAPPPWGNTSATPAPPPTSSWDSSVSAPPVDRSLLANPTAPPASSGWTSIGSTVAAPPLLIPQLPTTARSSLTPLNTTPIDSGPSFTTDSYRGVQPSSTTSPSWAQQSTSPSTGRTTSTPDDWAATWDASANNNNSNNAASIGRTAENPSRPVATRESDFSSSPRLGTNPQDNRSIAAKPTDSWTDDSWSRNSQPTSSSIGASIGASKTAGIGSASNSAPAIQGPANAPAIGSAGGNMNFNGANPNASQSPMIVNASKPTQVTTASGEPQPWVTLLAAILGLAGSLAGNVYLGWSYLDARQKYQALVRRTADTFRRTKVAA